MSKITIKNLGPVELFSQTTDESLMILIGEQASGKSTVAKAVFYCKSISDEFKQFLASQDNVVLKNHQPPFINFIKALRTKFVEYFGTTKHMMPFSIEYFFDNGERVQIGLKQGYANIVFSRKLRSSCEELINAVNDYYQKQMPSSFLSGIDFATWSSQKEVFNKMVNIEVCRIFEQDYTSIFIPAGRSMLSTNSEFFYMSSPNKYDVIMNDFIERIRVLQNQYSQRIEDIVEDKKKYSSEEIDFSSVKKATKLVRSILKGDYINDKLGERIYYSDDKFVKLIQASSGQQESLWIVLLIFSIILNNQKVYMVIEEPEAHLFPSAQKEIVELVMLMINSTGSQVIITTHSPYILSSTNLLLYSASVEGKSSDRNSIIDSDYRLSVEKVTAYMLKNHTILDIMEREMHMIEASNIDMISEEINDTLELLIKKEEQGGM